MMRARRLGAALIAAASLAGCGRGGLSIPQSPLLKYLERKSGTIAYQGVDGNVALMDQAGGIVRALSADGQVPEGGVGSSAGPFVYYQLPVWSPDGSRVAAVRVSGSGSEVAEVAVVVLPVAKGEPLTVFSSPSQVPTLVAWSPDSELLVFLAPSPSGSSYGFYLVPASGGEASLLDAGVPYGWAWSPRGKELVIHAGSVAGGLASARLAFLDVEDEVLEEGLGLVAGLFDTPMWAPNGRHVLVATWEEGKNQLFVTDRMRSEGAVLAEADGALSFMLSPNGQRVAYVADASGAEGTTSRLYVLDVPSRLAPSGSATGSSASLPQAKLLSGSDVVGAFFWSPDGARIAYFVPALVAVGQGDQAAAEEGEAAAEQLVVVLTLKIADARKGTNREVATFIPTPGFLGVVQRFSQAGQAVRFWSPDSRNVVYSAIDEQGPGIMVALAAESIEPRRIAGGMDAAWSRR